MQLYIVENHRQGYDETISEILAIFSDREDAENYIKENQSDINKAWGHNQHLVINDEHVLQ